MTGGRRGPRAESEGGEAALSAPTWVPLQGRGDDHMFKYREYVRCAGAGARRWRSPLPMNIVRTKCEVGLDSALQTPDARSSRAEYRELVGVSQAEAGYTVTVTVNSLRLKNMRLRHHPRHVAFLYVI